MATYIKPNAIKDASIEGIKIKDGTISSSKIDETVASKSYVDTQVKTVDDKTVALESKTDSLDSRTPVDSRISFVDPWMYFPEYSEDVQDVQRYISGFLQINNQMTNVDGLFNHIRDNNLAGKAVYFTIYDSYGNPMTAIIGNIDTGAVGYKISFSTISRYSDTRLNNSLIFFEIEIGNLTGDGIIIMNSRLMNIRIKDTLSQIGNRVTNAVQITYSELKSLRNAGKLVAGTQYRITNYTCTTTQTSTKSAGHVFDIIVTADDASTLNEVARAVKHEGDTYFANSDLSAWKLWYCLDNDTNRFAWADATNGKGVIYRMIDEFGNDVPYDFKNIQFYRKWDSGKSLWSTIPSDNTGVPCYTFSSSGNSATTLFTDMSLSISNEVHSNVIKEYIDSYSSNEQKLNNNCFFGNECYSNAFGNSCRNTTFGYSCKSNIARFGFDYNIFGNNCAFNIFGNRCIFNTFGNNCSSNSFGNNCASNSFGNNCASNSFGDDCASNSFGNNCSSNSFGNVCQTNTFGNYCNHTTTGNGFLFNVLGNDCYSNIFENNCAYVKFTSDSAESTKYNYYQNNHFGDECQYIVFTGKETASSSSCVQNYNFAQGLQGTKNAYLTIDGVRGRSFETYISKGTDGAIKESVIADTATKKYVDTEIDNIPIEKGTMTNSIVQKGSSNDASGNRSSAFGWETRATGNMSHTEGFLTLAQNSCEHAEGYANISIQGKTIHTVGIGASSTNRKNAHEIHLDGKHYIYGIGGYDGTNSRTEGIKTVQEVVAESANAVQITYSELKALRDNGNLVPGTQYRITDYTCTTTQKGTQSAGHPFDIIVTADDESTLNEEARAALHTGDEYFSGCNLSAWKIWYCLDNDANRFAWADSANGKGIIYRMIDESNNDAPYDFKNIQFYRKWDSGKSLWSTIPSDNTGVPCYTFSSSGNSATTFFTDTSLLAPNSIYSNVIGKYVTDNKQTLNNICFFGNNCYSNTFGNICYNNTFGNNFQENTFGNYFQGNTFGNYFQGNTFGNDCNNNTFGNRCYNNTFGNYCHSNTFGNGCYSNTFGNYCNNNTFGNYIQKSQFGDGVQYFSITTQQMATNPTSSYLKNYIRWLIVENGVRYVNAYVTGSTSNSSQCQNVRICLGVQGVDDNNRKTFDITSCINSKLNNVYQPANSKTTSV